MSRRSNRVKDFLNIRVRTTIHGPRESQKPEKNLIRNLSKDFQVKTEEDEKTDLIREKQNENPFDGRVTVSRGSYQLATLNNLILKESRSIPAFPQSTLHLKVVEDLQKMIPKTPKKSKSMKMCLRTCIRHLNSLKLKPQELAVVNRLIPKFPYGRPQSRLFMQYVKSGDLMEAERMLANDRYLAQVFDSTKMTALHWACLRGFGEMVVLLLSYNAFVDAVDISNRTPLHIAAKGGFAEIIYELLKYEPETALLTIKKESALKLAKNEKTRDIIKRYLKEKHFN